MRAHEEAEWTGFGVNPKIINKLSEISAYAAKTLNDVPLEYREDILRIFLNSILDDVKDVEVGTRGGEVVTEH